MEGVSPVTECHYCLCVPLLHPLDQAGPARPGLIGTLTPYTHYRQSQGHSTFRFPIYVCVGEKPSSYQAAESLRILLVPDVSIWSQMTQLNRKRKRSLKICHCSILLCYCWEGFRLTPTIP